MYIRFVLHELESRQLPMHLRQDPTGQTSAKGRLQWACLRSSSLRNTLEAIYLGHYLWRDVKDLVFENFASLCFGKRLYQAHAMSTLSLLVPEDVLILV